MLISGNLIFILPFTRIFTLYLKHFSLPVYSKLKLPLRRPFYLRCYSNDFFLFTFIFFPHTHFSQPQCVCSLCKVLKACCTDFKRLPSAAVHIRKEALYMTHPVHSSPKRRVIYILPHTYTQQRNPRVYLHNICMYVSVNTSPLCVYV